MATTNELRAVRLLLNGQRKVTLTGLLAVSSAMRERTTESKHLLVAQLRGLDEFANSTAHEEYRPA